ncbi:MAG: RNA-directed DNA polymerase [Muribaculaceae bacterium]|nr:RNA-directed DNA polymerase [Muribaculaceae bacterium]
MNVYSAENIKCIIERILKKEGLSAIVPEDFKNYAKEIKLHKSLKKDYAKELRRLRRIISRIKQENDPDSDQNIRIEESIFNKIDVLEFKLREEKELCEESEKKKIEAIEKYSKDLLIKIRGKRQNPKIKEFLLFEKKTFTTDDFDSKVIEQLIKEDIAKHYKRKPANRNVIIEQIKGLIGNKLPKCIIRTDIKSFFESVPMDKLIQKLETEAFVSPLTGCYLKKIRDDVKDMGGEGVPRGLSFSSYLAEIYLQRADDDIKNLPNLYFYQRYVDDIVIMFSVSNDVHWPYFSSENFRHWLQVKDIFENNGLLLHEDGEKKNIIYSGKTNKNEFEYLGYRFIIEAGNLTIRLSSHRRRQYEAKISAIIKYYNKTSRDNESLPNLEFPLEEGVKRRRRQPPLRRLFGQLSALTGNGMLKGPKSNIFTGVYYSNQYLTSIEDLKELDTLLLRGIWQDLTIPRNLFRYADESDPIATEHKIKKMITHKWSFIEGFKNRRFCKNSSYFKHLKEIDNLIK